MADNVIPGNPSRDDSGGLLQEQKELTEQATASAAENLVYLMQMLQDFSRTIKTVTTSPVLQIKPFLVCNSLPMFRPRPIF